MIKKEETFDPYKTKKYKRGDIIQVHLGFNIGHEEGGLHYAIVISKKTSKASGILTIIPLTSKKENSKITDYDIDLGSTIFDQLTIKYKDANKEIETQIDEIKNNISSCIKDIDATKELLTSLTLSLEKRNELFDKLVDKTNCMTSEMEKLNELEEEDNRIKKIQKEINHMKSGSIALVGQITTISKIRIYNPKNKRESLHGIKLSPDDLDKIDKKVRELYTNF